MNNPFEILEQKLSNIESLLNNLIEENKQSSPSSDSIVWLNLTELCNYLPDKPKKSTVYGWIQYRTIPFHKGSKNLRFLKSDIDKWLKDGRRKTFTEIENESKAYMKQNTKLK
jgi:excisionase family DNA binding protein